MPSRSPEQHRLMAAVAKNPAFAKKAGIPQRVGADFLKADKGRKFAKGGDMAKKFPPFMGKETKAEEAKEKKVKAGSFALYKKGEKAEGIHGKSGMAKPSKYAAGGGCELKGKTKGKVVKMAMGGMTPAVGMAPKPQMATGQFGNVGNPSNYSMGKAPQYGGAKPQGGLDPRAIAANPRGFAQMMQGAKAQEQARPGSTMLAQANRPMGMAPRPRMAAGGSVKTFAKGGGCELKGKTKGKFI